MALNNVFVYGSFMEGKKYRYLLEPFIKRSQPASVDGKLFDMIFGYAAMTDGEGVVHGELLELTNMSKALRVLDRVEDYYGENNPLNLYNRVTKDVKTANGNTVNAYAYVWAHADRMDNIGVSIPDGRWKGPISK